ncbi:MAG: DUF3576 domain-containing protein [Hyphomonadaceae bacterium]|nr:DUF3576 domain-containing protein [Hyphomonadaceae bacterium]MBP9234373.1 DUF3576 domain-containing protein [Hyphomonadaceae bacterium]
MFSRIALAAVVATALVGVSGCSIFGSETANTSTASSADIGPEENGALGVNAYLWRASLDTLSFLPLASADPYGGVIITDWYANPEKKDERMKATVYILDTRLRADGVSAAVFRETLTNGVWTPASVSPDTNVALENAILSKARELRLSGIQ